MKVLSSTPIYNGKVFDVRLDKIREGDVEYEREIVEHRGSAVIVPLFADGTIAMVRQYRHATGKYLLEIPAGMLEAGEEPLEGARRELQEEIGVTAAKIEPLAAFYISPGFLTEKMNVFLATDLTETGQQLEDDELIELERIPLDAAADMALDGRIEDAKSIVGILMTQKIAAARAKSLKDSRPTSIS
jgi:ADP-ribose pyrophosphatase